MTQWRKTTVEEIANAARYSVVGGPFGSALGRKDYTAAGVPVIRGAQLGGPGCFSHDDLVFVSDEKADQHTGNLAYPGDILVTQRGTVGQVGLVPEFAPYGRYLLSQSQMKLAVDPSVADAKFVYYWLRSADAQHEIHASTVSAGVPHINLATFKGMKLALPPLATQKLISGVLSTLDDLIENNRRRVEVLEEMARTIYREWFVHFRYPGHETAAMVDSPFGAIPDEWERTPLADLVSTQYGYTESASDAEIGPRYLRGMDINKHSYIDWSTVPYCPIDDAFLNRFRIEVGDVFVIRMADPGKVGICEIETNAVFASYLVRMRPSSDRISSYFLFFTLSADEYQGWVTGASTGATRKSVSAKVMTEPRIVLPPRHVQQEFEGMIRPIRSMMTRLIEQNAALSALRGKLLPKLVTGQIDVSSVDLDALVEDSVA